MVRTPTTPAQTPLRNGKLHTAHPQPAPPAPPHWVQLTGYIQHSHLTVDHIGRLLLLPCQRLVRRLHGVSHSGQVGLWQAALTGLVTKKARTLVSNAAGGLP